MIIDGKNSVLGRVATYAAKQAILGETIDIVNCEEIILSGKKEDLLARYKQRRERGEPFHGPFYPRVPESFVKRAIRGMLPYKQSKGREAFKRIKCHVGVPQVFEGKEMIKVKGSEVEKLGTLKYMSVKEICNLL